MIMYNELEVSTRLKTHQRNNAHLYVLRQKYGVSQLQTTEWHSPCSRNGVQNIIICSTAVRHGQVIGSSEPVKLFDCLAYIFLKNKHAF